jgi:hypothetical protein
MLLSGVGERGEHLNSQASTGFLQSECICAEEGFSGVDDEVQAADVVPQGWMDSTAFDDSQNLEPTFFREIRLRISRGA